MAPRLILHYVEEVHGWARNAANASWELAFASAWANWWKLLGRRETFCQGRLVCLMATTRFEPADGPRPMYTEDAEGNLVPTANFDKPHPEPYVCDLRGVAIDYARLMQRFANAEPVEARSYGSSAALYEPASLRLGGCIAPSKQWRTGLSGRCKSSQILEHTSRSLVAMEVDEPIATCAIKDSRLTVLIVRPAVLNLWEAHFALVEATVRLAALGLIPLPAEISGSNQSQVIFLPPDSANAQLFGIAAQLWQTLLGGAIIAASDVQPRSVHCYTRAILLDFCCEAADLCPPSRDFPDRASEDALIPASQFSTLPCAHSGVSGCAYGLFRYHFHQMLNVKTLAPVDPHIILISRRTARSRRLVDESKLVEDVQIFLPPKSKIDAIDFALMPIEKQARVVAGVDVLAGIHGAGLTLMMFLPPRASVVEISLLQGWFDDDGSSKGSPPMYSEMAKRLGLGYVVWAYNGQFGPNYTMSLSAQVLATLINRAMELR